MIGLGSVNKLNYVCLTFFYPVKVVFFFSDLKRLYKNYEGDISNSNHSQHLAEDQVSCL